MAVPALGDTIVSPLELAEGRIGSVQVPLDADSARVVLAVSALGDGEHDPEDREWERTGHYTYSAHVQTLPDEEDDDPDGGCACDVGDPDRPRAMALLGLLSLLALVAARRGRRGAPRG